jgi:predicted metal-dependent peptidase
MGSIRRFNTRLLVAVDVSGSVSDKSVSDFYGVVNSAFRYGFESVDVLQFDHGVQSVVSLTKAVKDFAVCGRGGTSFQEPVDFAHMNGYEGLVILTDGEASPPRIPEGMKTGILWVCVDRDSYDEHKDWMSRTGRVCMMQLRK